MIHGRSEPQVVSVLLCHSHVPMALECLGSLKRFSKVPHTFRIHDDGSLSEEDAERLETRLGHLQVVWRQEADEEMRGRYPRLRHALEARRRLPLILKALDIPSYAGPSQLIYVDSDVLFLRPFSWPILSTVPTSLVFMRDREQSYSLRSWQKLLSPAVRLPAFVNTGIVLATPGIVDVEYLDWFVARSRHHGIYSMLEQTFWAALGGRRGCVLLAPDQVRVVREGEEMSTLVAGHFTARSRHLLSKLVGELTVDRDGLTPVPLGTVSPGLCTAADLLAYEARRAAGRLRDLIRKVSP